MPEPDESPPARGRRGSSGNRPAATTDDADDTAQTEADEALADRERHAELERLRHKLHRKFH